MPRHLRSLMDLSSADLRELMELSLRLKSETKRGVPHPRLAGKSIALIFHKPSLRTKVSFEVAMTQLGGASVVMSNAEIGIGSREAEKDVARVLAGYCDAIVIRTFAQKLVDDLAEWSSVPVVNALTDAHHPCQILADLLTVREVRGSIDHTRVAFLGDGNNVCASWIEAAALVPLDLRIGVGAGYDPDAAILERARSAGLSEIRIFRDPREAVRGAHVVYTDVWASMGQETEKERRMRDLIGFQVNRALMEHADPGAVVMHCLPAHRDEEITDEVIESPQSVVFQEAENRLHAQKALLVMLMEKGPKAA